LFIFFLGCQQGRPRCYRGDVAWLAVEVVVGIFPLDDMVVEIVVITTTHIDGLDLGLESQLRWLLALVGSYRPLIIGHWM
jgi:hypothetical protein